ncbi:efflux RND transporter periplasmic adaptor subunit [Derxia gummosa]|uniref:Efflux RND transporter periplasmic adaptor subunit n=1 Tax=Derxia gummosa DSM 723 TaxID=1121388 RepID=A0A8B6X4Z7_9BURK|nr:efflux RND transporter periplasmic adaptor subunit [Derxia gummosa]
MLKAVRAAQLAALKAGPRALPVARKAPVKALAPLTLALAAALAAPAAGAADAPPDNRIRTQLASPNAVTVASEIGARITALPVPEGGSFKRGQLLASFDCSAQRAQLDKAQATLDAARQQVKVNARLVELNSISKLEVDQAEARAKEAQAEVSYMQTMLTKCSVSAPFAGRVAKRQAASFQVVAPGTPILDIVETGTLELKLIVPSRWLAWLKPGTKFSIEIDELGRSFPAHVVRLGAQIDPVSQSLPVTGAVDGDTAALLPGMSGWAVFPK